MQLYHRPIASCNKIAYGAFLLYHSTRLGCAGDFVLDTSSPVRIMLPHQTVWPPDNTHSAYYTELTPTHRTAELRAESALGQSPGGEKSTWALVGQPC